ILGLIGPASVAGFTVPLTFVDNSGPRAGRIDVVMEVEVGRYTPDVIYAQPGDTVHVTLKTKDIPHGFSIVGLEVDIVAMLGEPAEAVFVVGGEARLHEWYCTTFCGRNHSRMSGSLIVGER
ncbi:MAG: hypothetical protein V3S83_10900, partial [Gemmatimonadota bacterium]